MYAYNPRKKTAEQLAKMLVGGDRWDTLKDILKEMDLKDDEEPKQHWMIIGPRGIGKSHLMALLYHEIKKDKRLDSCWIPLLFPEELRIANTLQRFLERISREILLELKDNPICDELKLKIARVNEIKTSERTDSLFDLISWVYKISGKHIVVIAENFQQLFGKKLQRIEQKKLRAFLQTNDAILIISSATTIFDALHDHSHPFYNFFHIKKLMELDFDEMKILIAKLLSESGRADLAEKVESNDARLKALYSFTGGNPRMAVFMSDFLRAEIPSEMLGLMDNILDQLTPYFENIFSDIPDHLLDVINALSELEPAQSPKEIAEYLEVPQATMRNYLKKLKEAGYVRIAFSKGKSNYYCLNEYLYRIWYQMRDSSQREETRWIMELLLILYSPTTTIQEKNKVGVCNNEALEKYSYDQLISETDNFIKEDPESAPIYPAPAYPAHGEVLEKMGNKDFALFSYLNYIRGAFEIPVSDFDFIKVYQDQIHPILKSLDPSNYIKQFYEVDMESKLSKIQLSTLLLLLEKYDTIGEELPNIIGKNEFENRNEIRELNLFIFTIKFCVYLRLCSHKLQDALRIVDLLLSYIKMIPIEEDKEEEVSNFLLTIFNIQIQSNIDSKNTLEILKRFKDEADVPFNEVFLKIWKCISEPDSIEAKKYLNDKGVAEIVKELNKKEKIFTCDI
jgi:DNA-binding transcriptional ArsR family regulator